MLTLLDFLLFILVVISFRYQFSEFMTEINLIQLESIQFNPYNIPLFYSIILISLRITITRRDYSLLNNNLKITKIRFFSTYNYFWNIFYNTSNL